MFKKCELIPRNKEQILSFNLDNIQFLDSLQFINESLAQIVKNLQVANYKFPITTNIFREQIANSEERKSLLLRKGVFPYDYFDDMKKLDDKYLPEKEQFYSTLTQDHISNEDYQHACNIWDQFNIKNFGEYHDFYLILDTTLLADCFQQFRKVIYKDYGLEPCHFYSIPRLALASQFKNYWN